MWKEESSYPVCSQPTYANNSIKGASANSADPVPQITEKGKRDNLGIIFRSILLKHSCDPSLEPSSRHGSNDGSQHMFSLRNKTKIIFELSAPSSPLVWSSELSFREFGTCAKRSLSICAVISRPRDNIFFMLNSAEREILNAHMYENIKKFSFCRAQMRLQYTLIFCS